MQYHPDRSDDPRAAAAFVLVNEAYEYLKNPSRRIKSTSVKTKTGRHRDEEIRKDRYEDWDAYQKDAARQRAYRHAQSSAEQFARSPIYKAAAVIDKVYNYLFIAIGILMILIPIFNIEDLRNRDTGEVNQYGIVVPFILGVAFIYGIWYFVFKLREEEL
jgi:hypothetical protein